MEIAADLIRRGANINTGDVDNSQPLHCAAISGDTAIAALLLSHGVDINVRDDNGLTPLHFASSYRQLPMAGYLLEHGADVNAQTSQGLAPIIYAAFSNNLDLATLLVQHGVDINIRTDDGSTPLHAVTWQGTIPTAELLLEHGADINARDNNGWTPLTNAAHRNVEFTRLFLSHGADVNPEMPFDTVNGECRTSGITPLYGAVRSDSLNTVMLLVEHDADINIPDDNGVTPLHYAVGNCNSAIARYLLSQGAALSVEDKYNRTELHTACVMGMHEIANLLIESRADVSAHDRFGRTPLDYAMSRGFSHVAELLKDKGACINKEKDVANTTELLHRQLNEQEAIIWYLEHSGWAIKTKNHFLVIDYFLHNNRTPPEGASLASGYVIPETLQDQHMTVLVTHHHGDHYNPGIFSWQETVPDIRYILGFRPRDIETSGYLFAGPRTDHTVDDMKICTIKSTDAGVGFIIEVDGLVIFHAGDHANGYVDMSGEYPVEIDYVADMNLDIDIAFFGITGCSLGDPVSVKKGVEFAIEKLTPAVLFPQHAGMATYRYQEFAEEVAAKNYPTKIVCAVDNGDRFIFTNGSIAEK
jgi:ankyrin repeat protein